MKFLHCSDLHLGKKPYFGSEAFRNKRFEDYFNAFERIIEQAKENNAKAILVAGDFFDKKETHPNILSNTEKLLGRCKDYGIEVVVIEGNHDLIYKNKEAESWIIYLESKNLLKRPLKNEPVLIDGTKIFGLGYPGALVEEELEEFAKYCEENHEHNCVLLVHTALGNNEFIGGFLKDKSALDKLKNYAIYIAGGHGHKLQKYPETEPFFFVPGSPEYYDFGEKAELKTAIVFDTVSKEHKILEQSPRNCIMESVTLDVCSQENFREEFEKFLSLFNITAEDIVIFEIRSIANDFIPDIKWAEKRVLEAGALFAEVKWKKIDARSFSHLDKRNSVEEIELEQIKKWQHWGGAPDIAAKTLTEMKTAINDGQLDISSIFDSALKRVLA